jgi:carboxylate-amine ligase
LLLLECGLNVLEEARGMGHSSQWWARIRRRPWRRSPVAAAEPPAVVATPAELEAGYRDGFRRDDIAPIGLEEELILVNAAFEPEEGAEWLLDELGAGCYLPELRAAQVELALPAQPAVAPLVADLALARGRLARTLAGRLRLLAAGGHPTAARPVRVTGRPRYLGIGRECAWAMRRGLPSGLHIHVGLADPDDALAVYNAARSYLPDLAALAANSPFFEGVDSTLASSRLKLLEDLPRSGVPPAFESWQELAEFVAWGVGGRLFEDVSFLWWDLRLRPEYGTLEFRIADTQTLPEHTAALAANSHTLVAALRARIRAGEPLPVHPTHAIAENRWRAVRDGLDAELVDLETGVPGRVRDRIARLLVELEPHAAELGCGDELDQAWPLVATNGAERQRAVAAERGVDGLAEWLVEQTEASGVRAEARLDQAVWRPTPGSSTLAAS